MPLNDMCLGIKEIDLFDFSGSVLLDIDYRRIQLDGIDQAELHLYLREEEKRRRIAIRGVLPYFYINADTEVLDEIRQKSMIVHNWISKTEHVEKYTYDQRRRTKLIKIYGNQPWLVPNIREIFSQNGIDYYEADIPFTHRFLIDEQIFGLRDIGKNSKNTTSEDSTGDYKPRILSLDIEIDSSVDSDELQESLSSILEDGSRSITAVSLWWGYDQQDENKQVFVLRDVEEEADFLSGLFLYIWRHIDPDVIVTYNGDRFDFPYIVKRMEVLGLPLSLLSPHGDTPPREPSYGNGWIIPGVLVFDLFRRTRWIYTTDGKKSLNSVAEQLLGEKKIELPVDHGEIWKRALQNKKDMALFEAYALRDAELTYKLFFAMNMVEWLEVIKITGGPPAEAMYFTERQNGEFLVYRLMYEDQILIPPVPTPEERKIRKKYRVSAKGGLVFEPKRELATSVLICDFTSMYPSIMSAHNVGAESFRGTDHPVKQRFKDNPETTMAKMQRMMLNRRVAVKEMLRDDIETKERERLKRLNQALKIVANSTFGSYNFIGSRFYNTDIAGTITEIGRTYLREVSHRVSEFAEGYETIYGDTDSVFIETPLDQSIRDLWETPVEKRDYHKQVQEIDTLLRYLQEALPVEMRLELEDIAYRILFHKGAKKRYTYLSAITGKIAIVGLEAVRNDWAPFSRDIQKYAIEVILNTGDLDVSKKKIIEFIRKKMASDDDILMDEVITTGPIKRQPSRYKSITPAVAAFNHHARKEGLDKSVEWKYYDYFPYVIIKGSGPLKDRARHPDYVDVTHVDLDHYISRALAAINRFNVNIALEEVKAHLYKDLDDYF